MYQTSIRNKKKRTYFNNDKDMNYKLDPDNEEYAYVIKLLGNCRAKVICNNGIEAIGVIRGSLRKFNNRILIENGDLIVVSKRDFQDNKVDIVHKFNIDQCQSLVKNKEISDILINCYYNKTKQIKEDILVEDQNYIEFESNSSDDDI
jgi:translation initiation factor 1A